MEVPIALRDVLAEGRNVRFIGDSIFSVLPAGAKHHYDRRSAVYDRMVSTRLYNSVMWGSSPREYSAFAREAVDSCAGGRILDAGCGSMLFSAAAFLESRRPVIAFDQSLAMLQRARQRLIELAGSVPEHIVLLQADLSDIPFRVGVFKTVLFMNVLHHYEAASTLLRQLKSLLAAGGALYLTSLISNKRFIGDSYLKALYLTGEFVRPRTGLELKEILEHSLGEEIGFRTNGNMAFATARVYA